MKPLKLLAVFSVFILSDRCAEATVLYVDLNSTNPVPPYADWFTAATNIQNAVDAASDGDLILVTNGVYQTGARVTSDSANNRVVVIRPVVLQSVNGPLATVIDGAAEMRCVYLAGGAQLVGFTVTNGCSANNGGGIFCESAGVVSNCVVAGCSAANNGGGVSGGTLFDCTLAGNSASAAGGGANGSTLNDCTLSGNYAHANNGNQSGGGAEGCILNACVLNGNYARNCGGAADASTLNRCLVTNNWVIWGVGGGINNSTADDCLFNNNSGNAGGGAEGSSLNNCTLTGNYCNEGEGEFGGGADGCNLNNCILYFNNGNNDNYFNSTLNYCCTTPFPGGAGNFTNEPAFVDLAGGDFHLQTNSPCINAGNNSYAAATNDLDGNPRIQGLVADVGAYEFPISMAIAADYTNVAVGFTVHFISQVFAGNISNSFLDFGDGTVLTSQYSAAHSWATPGDFLVTLTVFSDVYPGGNSASVMVHVMEGNYFVALDGTNPVAPYTSWDTAATNIQVAVDVSAVGGTVLVANGIYLSGGHPVYPLSQSNRVAITKPLTVRSVNGPEVTVIEGYHATGAAVTFNSTRCVYLTNGAALIGFTVTNGGTQPGNDQDGRETIGGGIWCESSAAVVSNCVIVSCVAVAGGGVENGTLYNCSLLGNYAGFGGGADNSLLNNCTLTGNSAFYGGWGYGGGASGGTLNNCVLANNSADYGGGVCYSAVNNCALYRNSSGSGGGGAGNCTLNNSTLTGNSAGSNGGGADSCTLNNCIAYFNRALSETNCSNSTLNYSCTTPLPDSNFNSNRGTNNLTDPPQLADNFHLNAASLCIGAGSTNFSSGMDIDGEAWLNPPSIGCDEFYPDAAGGLAVSISSDYLASSTGFPLTFNAQLTGHASANVWDFGDGTTVSNQVFEVRHAWNSPGTYAVIFTAFNDDHPDGVSATNSIQIVAQPFYFVNAAGTNPVAPFLTRDTAAIKIQDAIDAAIPSTNTIVFVTNGIYEAGALVASDGVTNRVVVNKPFTVQGVGGAVVIDGGATMRCVYLFAGAQISGLTLTNGNSTGDGGGATCENGGVISNCVIAANFAAGSGGGVNSGTIYNSVLKNNSCPNNGGGANGATLNNCALTQNSANEGGGADNCTLNNCTGTFNSGFNGGGAANSTLGNCIVYYNNSPNSGVNFSSSTLNFCCTVPLPANGTNNFTDAPRLADTEHIAATSPCLGAGSTNFVSGNDIDGEAWVNPPSVGCDEFYSGAATGDLSVTVSVDYPTGAAGLALNFSGAVFGHASSNLWDFADGATTANSLTVARAFSAPGDYAVVFTAFNDSNPGGVSATQIVHIVVQPVAYVSLASVNPVSPYDSWGTAATNIQDAVDAVIAGGRIIVSNGVYQVGGRIVSGIQSNRVAVTKPVMVASVNGPVVTTIVGNPVIGDSAVRGVYLAVGATLTGFTVTQGAATLGSTEQENSGGGIYCADGSATIFNCVITANAVAGGGGGVMRGTINNCIITSNTATYFQYYGGGAGAHSAVLNNCLIAGNSGGWSGGGVANSTLNNCTVVNNWSGHYGGAFDGCFATNCIVYYNSGDNGVNSVFDHCDRTPDPGGAGNITDEPLFVDATNGDFHLQNISPCVNAGDNTTAAGSTDLDGNLRIFAGTVDIGAYELQSLPSLNVAIQSDFMNVTVGYALPLHALIAPRVPAVVHWDFGDGTSADGLTNVVHQWASPGDYAVVLTTEDVNSNYSISNSATLVIHVVTNFVYYVDAGGTNPVAPYDSWETAATKIQDAVDAAFPSPRSTVIVTNGTYLNLSRYAPNIGQSTVIVDKPVMVRSVNGPAATAILGVFYAQRGAYLADGAVLAGFTLTGGNLPYAYGPGGGVRCESTGGALVINCVISGNSAWNGGGGVYGGTLINCVVSSNFSFSGGGANSAALVNCLINGNSAWLGGGANACSLTNCTVNGNSGLYANGIGGTLSSTLANCIVTGNSQGNYDDSSTVNFCCTTPLPASGIGNFTNNPLFVDAASGDFHLQNISPCINVGNNAAVAVATDFDGQPRIFGGTVDMGAYELQALPAWFVSIHPDYTNVVVGYGLHLVGVAWPWAYTALDWNFGDGTSVSNDMNVVHAWSAPGDYPVVLTVFNDTYPGGLSATQLVHVVSPTLAYVSITSTNPVAPFSSWDSAATNIQDAVDAVADGGMVIVSNGVYQTGGKTFSGSLSNRVVVARQLMVASVNGPLVTTILGNPEAGGNAMRGVYLARGATLSGFTVAQGATSTAYDGSEQVNSGGGVYCEDASAVVENCIITRNSAIANGGGVMRGTITHSIVSSNSVFYYAFFGWGGGAAYCSMDNCLLVGNRVFLVGGGASSCTLNNCTVVGNYAYYYPSALDASLATNCIIQFNSGLDHGNCTYDHCCATSLSGGAGNFADDPLFVDMTSGDFRLQTNSPCLNTGNPVCFVGATDLDGRTRVFNGTVDLGAYEFQSAEINSLTAWLQRYGLPVDGSADLTDSDGDGMNNWQEQLAGTDPTNPRSVLQMLPLSTGGGNACTVTWQSVAGKKYFVQRARDLTSQTAFSTIMDNIIGQDGTTSYADTNSNNGNSFFYRVGIQ